MKEGKKDAGKVTERIRREDKLVTVKGNEGKRRETKEKVREEK